MNKKGLFIFLVVVAAAAAAVYFAAVGKEERDRDSVINAYLLYAPAREEREVTLFLPDRQTDGFRMQKDAVFESPHTVNMIKQLVILLQETLKMTGENAPEPGANGPVEEKLRDVYITDEGICYIDFSDEVIKEYPGGTTGEYLTVYSFVNSVTYNFPGVKGVVILIGGEERDSFAGHLDIKGVIYPGEEAKPAAAGRNDTLF
ncbi:MAG: GerMN domain-containing protein [Candidatus Goldiibacteriota bacterium]